MPSEEGSRRRKRLLTRRRFLAGCVGGVGVGALGAGYARYVEPFWPKLERLSLDLPGLHPDLAGVRVLHLSDLHASPGPIGDYLHKQLERCAALSPDLVLITGDFVTRGAPVALHEVGSLMRCLARFGIFAVLGNHDYGVTSPQFKRSPGTAAARYADRVVAELSAAGVNVLRNESRVLTIGAGRLQLVGLEDYWGGYFDPQAAFADAQPDCPSIALSHNPDAIVFLKQHPCDWVLSGHTHGGQVRIPLLGCRFCRFRIGSTTWVCSMWTGFGCTSVAAWATYDACVSTAGRRSPSLL